MGFLKPCDKTQAEICQQHMLIFWAYQISCVRKLQIQIFKWQNNACNAIYVNYRISLVGWT